MLENIFEFIFLQSLIIAKAFSLFVGFIVGFVDILHLLEKGRHNESFRIRRSGGIFT